MENFIPGNSFTRMLAKFLINQAGVETFVPGDSDYAILRKILTNQVNGSGGGGASPSDANPQPLGTPAPGTSPNFSRADHVHPLESGSFSPVVTFATPGDLSVVYSTPFHGADWVKAGNLYTFNCRLIFVPTYTSAAGNFLVTGFPQLANDNFYIPLFVLDGYGTIPAGTIAIALRIGTFDVVIRSHTSAAFITWSTAQIVSGVAYNLQLSGSYIAA